jgi:tRNA(Ile2) C34 agmatinyltransferase TiaS
MLYLILICSYKAYCGICGKTTEHEGSFRCTECGR